MNRGKLFLERAFFSTIKGQRKCRCHKKRHLGGNGDQVVHLERSSSLYTNGDIARATLKSSNPVARVAPISICVQTGHDCRAYLGMESQTSQRRFFIHLPSHPKKLLQCFVQSKALLVMP
jgi:hypothetical protein